MAQQENSGNNNSGKCSQNECFASWIVFILVAGVIISALVYMVTDLCRSPKVQDVIIRVEIPDSVKDSGKGTLAYRSEDIDSLVRVVTDYELKLDEKYQYLLESRQDDERFKTWGALIVGVIVSICSFWGYKSLKDLREDITRNTEGVAERTVNKYLDDNLKGKVETALTGSLKSDVVKIIQQHVLDTLNSSEDPIVKTKVNEKIESEEFDKKLQGVIHEKVVEVVEEMVLVNNRAMHQPDHHPHREDDEMQLM